MRIAVLGVGVAVISALLPLAPGDAAAFPDGCPDIDVVFARGTAEPPGVGWIGQQFVDALRWRTGGRSLGVYPVNYPASHEFVTTVGGVIDASTHIRGTAANCPNTEMVLGGYSRGAALIGYATAATIPPGYVLTPDVPGPLPPEVADHVAAVVLLGKPSEGFLTSLGAPPLVIGPDYAGKTIDLCAPGDPICSAGTDDAAHGAYAANGMTAQAADFAAERLGATAQQPPGAAGV
ncbi:MAG TPA: cutinase family protein [Mycobacterium sp.]|nr:cutinase family protein [Mycobacterium sp.]